jgi:hypothetical protein
MEFLLTLVRKIYKKLDGAYLQGANLADTRIIQDQIKFAYTDEDTQLPDNIRNPL